MWKQSTYEKEEKISVKSRKNLKMETSSKIFTETFHKKFALKFPLISQKIQLTLSKPYPN